MNREEINEYDLGLPVPIAPLEERRLGIPAAVWDCLSQAKAQLGELFGARLHELRLFGSFPNPVSGFRIAATAKERARNPDPEVESDRHATSALQDVWMSPLTCVRGYSASRSAPLELR